MVNFLEGLRLKQLLDNISGQGVSPPNQEIPDQSDVIPPTTPNIPTPAPQGVLPDIAQRMASMYHPDTTAQDRFTKLSQNYPQEPQASTGRKVLASIAGGLTDLNNSFDVHGHPTPNETPDAGKSIFDDMTGKTDYNKRILDWKNQIAPAEQAASIERQTNSNERQSAYQSAALQLRQEADDAKALNDSKKTAIASNRADIYAFKVQHPGVKFDFKGATVMAGDPTTGKVVDTGVPTSHMTDLDKLNLENDNKVGQIAATGEQNRQTATAKAADTTQVDEKSWKIGSIPDPNDPTKQMGIQYNEATGEIRPIKFNGKPTGPITNPSTKPGVTNPAANQAIQQTTRETLSLIDELMDDKGNLTPSASDAVGISRMTGLQYIDGTQTRAGNLAIKRLKDMLTLDLIGQLKAQSQTGATGFGRLTNMEVGILSSAASKLDPTLDKKTFTTELQRIKDKLTKILQPADGSNPTTTVKEPTAQDLINKYNGGGGQ